MEPQLDPQKQLELALEEIRVLSGIIKKIPGKIKIDEIIQTIIDDTVSFLNVDRIAIAFANKKTRLMEAQWVSGISLAEVRKMSRVLKSDDIGFQCVIQKKPMVCYDCATDPRVDPEIIEIGKYKSFVILPLIVGDEAIGWIGLINWDPAKKITLEDVEKYQRFVDTLSLIFHNSRLYKELENWNQTLEERVEQKTRELTDAHDTIWKINENMAAIIENTTTGIIATELNGKIMVFNKAAGNIFKSSLSDMPEKNVAKLFKPEDFLPIWKALTDSKETVEFTILKNVEREMVSIDGSLVPVNLSVTRLVSRDGVPFCYLFAIQSLREIRFLENKILQGEKLKTIGQMGAGISHEMNTQLGMLKGSLTYLRMVLPDCDEKILKHFNLMEETIERGTNFVSELLSFAKPSPPKFSKLNLRELFTKVFEMINLRYSSSKISIQFKIEEGLPYIYGDYQKLCQVFLNLLDNAIYASQNHGEIKVIAKTKVVDIEDLLPLDSQPKRKDDPLYNEFYLFRRSVSSPGDKLSPISKSGDTVIVVDVIDSGTGIPPEVVPNLFNPFVSTKQKSGTGLGLIICQNIIKGHYGAISLYSQLDKGTTISLKFPIFDDLVRFERMI